MRTAWAFVVVCLMAVSGVAPARDAAARDDLTGEHARDLRGDSPALPAITHARTAVAALATRPRPAMPQLPPAVLATPPVLRGLRSVRAIETADLARLDPSIALALRSARGPPA